MRADVPRDPGPVRAEAGAGRAGCEGRSYAPGRHELPWDVRLANGASAGAGVFFYAIEAGGFRSTKRMVRLR